MEIYSLVSGHGVFGTFVQEFVQRRKKKKNCQLRHK